VLSVSDNMSEGYEPIDTDLKKAIRTKNYSTGIFKDGKRSNENFIEEHYIAFDIDEGWSIEDATSHLFDYWHIIAPTRNHRKEKHGKIEDRFRVIFKLSKPITDPLWHKSTWLYISGRLLKSFDPATKDVARCFYPSPYIHHFRDSGILIDPIEPKVKEVKPVEINPEGKGTLGNKSLNFLLNGAKPGTRNPTVYAVATDMRDQGYTYEEALTKLYETNDRLNVWTSDEADEFEGVVQNAFDADGTYEKRVEPSGGLDLQSIDQLYNCKDTLKWLVNGLMTCGGLSLICGMPKSGKSTLVRQLARSISRGEKFLGRQVIKGGVLYLAIEEQPEMLKEQLQKLGINRNDNIMMHVGPVNHPDRLELLKQTIEDVKPTLVIIDTIMLFLQLEDINNYSLVNPAFAGIRNIARSTGAHILGVHHQNKSMIRGTTSVMGSVGIHGAVDNLIMFDVIDNNRHITSSQRGGKPFTGNKLTYKPETDEYTL